MSLFLKNFNNHSEYEAYTADTVNFILPNVSICILENDVHYNPYVEPAETRVVAKFNVTDISNPTKIANKVESFSFIEIDGVEQSTVMSAYTFSTTGEHIVKYGLTVSASIENYAFASCSNLISITIPDIATNFGNGIFAYCISLTSCTIGNNVISIGDNTFLECNNLVNC